MDTELLQALAAEIAEHMDAQRLEIRREFATQIAEAERAHAEHLAVLRERLAAAEHRLEAAQAEFTAQSAIASDPVAALTLDADGTLHLVQRSGAHLSVRLPDWLTAAREAVSELGDDLSERLQAEAHAHVARVFDLFCNAPAWSPTAVYAAGDIVQTHIGRTYRVRAGVRAALGRDPDDDAEHWERLGTGGLRVFKSRPPTLTPGDVFSEHDARFLHDGHATVLLVPRTPKTSDIERAGKVPTAIAQAVQADVRRLEPRIGEALEGIERSQAAAHDATELGVQALAQVEALRSLVEDLQRRLDELTPPRRREAS